MKCYLILCGFALIQTFTFSRGDDATTTPKPDPKSGDKQNARGTITDNPPKGKEIRDDVKHLKAVTLLDPPNMMVKISGGGHEFSGYMYDVLMEAVKDPDTKRKVDLDLFLQHDNRYGFEEELNVWNGIIGALANESADIGIAAFAKTYKRTKTIDFSQPVLHGGYRVLYKIPDSWHPGPAMVTLLKPFSPGLWVMIVLMFVLASLGLYAIGRYSPYEDIAFVGKTATYEGLTLPNSMLYTFSSLVWQGYTNAPKSYSGRLLASIWWVFSVLTVSAYIAGLCVILFTTDPEIRTLPFTTLDEMTKQSKVGVMVVENSTTHRYLKSSHGDLEKKIYAMINIQSDKTFMKNTKEAIEKMVESDGKFVLIMDGPAAEYIAHQEPCDKMVLGEPISDHSYSFACRNSSNVCSIIDKGLIRLQEDGTLSKLKKKWFHSGCDSENHKNYMFEGLPFFDTFGSEADVIMPRLITIKRFSSAFIILALGIIGAALVLLIEIYWAKRHGTAAPQRINKQGRDDDMERIENEFHDDLRA